GRRGEDAQAPGRKPGGLPRAPAAPGAARQGLRRVARPLEAAPGGPGQEVRGPRPGDAEDRALDPRGDLRVSVETGARPPQALRIDGPGRPEADPELRPGYYPGPPAVRAARRAGVPPGQGQQGSRREVDRRSDPGLRADVPLPGG